MTTTNVADARDLYTFHRTNPFFTGSIQFRVRAQRKLYGEVVSGLPVTTYGPWSPIYTDVQPPLSLGTLGNVATVSDIQSDTSPGLAHALTPGFVFSGDSGGPMDYNGGAPAELFRVYIATDEDCVNIVYRGAVVGSPAYAPRTTGPLELPTDSIGVATARGDTLEHGPEGKVLMVDGTVAVTNEEVAAPAAAPRRYRRCPGPDDRCKGRPARYRLAHGRVLLDCRSRRPGADSCTPRNGRCLPALPSFRYRETELPQDACQSGRVMRFGKTTPPVVTSSSRPFASGLSPKGRLTSAARATPVVLRHAARRLGVRPRRPGVRDPVEQVRESVAAARLVGDRGHLVAAPARARQLVLPRPRLQPLAPQAPADGVVDADAR